MQPHRCSWAGRESWPQPSRRQEAVGRWPVSWRPRWQPPTSPLEARGRPGDQPELSRGRGQGCLPPPRGCLEEEDPGRRSLFHRSAPHPQAREGGGPAENRTQPRGWERQDILSSTWGNSALPWRRGRCRGGRPQHICAQREAAQGVAGPLRCGGQCAAAAPALPCEAPTDPGNPGGPGQPSPSTHGRRACRGCYGGMFSPPLPWTHTPYGVASDSAAQQSLLAQATCLSLVTRAAFIFVEWQPPPQQAT